MKETELRVNLLLLLLTLAILLATTSLAPAQIAPELSAGVAIFAAGPPVSVTGSISQRVGSIKAAELSLDALFLATPGESSGMAGAICVKAKTAGNMKAGAGYAPARNTTEISAKNLFVSLQYVKATPAPAALGFGPTDPPIMELTIGSQTDQQGKPYLGMSCTKRFDNFSDLFKF